MFFPVHVPDNHVIVVNGGRQTETGAGIATWLKCPRLSLEVILEGLEPLAGLTTPTGREAQLLADTALNILYCQLADLYNCWDAHDGCVVLELPLSTPSQLQNLILFMARDRRVRGLIIREKPQDFMFPHESSNTITVPGKEKFYEEESFESRIQKAIEKQNQQMISELNKLSRSLLYNAVVSELDIVPGTDDISLFEESSRGESPVSSPVLQAIEYLLFKRAEAQGPLSISMRQWGQIKYDLLGKQMKREKSAFCFQGKGDHELIYKPRLSEPSSSIKESAIGKVRVDHDSIYKPQPSEPRSGGDSSSSSSECGSYEYVTVPPDFAESRSSSCRDGSSSSSEECALSENATVAANSAEPSSGSGDSSSLSSECELCGSVIVAADSAYSCWYCPLDLHKACAELQGVSRFLFPPFDLTFFRIENHCCEYCEERGSSFTDGCKSCYYTSILKSHLRPMIVLHPFNRDQYIWIKIVLHRFSKTYCAACGNTISSAVRYYDQYRTLYYGFFCIARLPLEVEHEHFRYRHTLKLMCEPQQEFDSYICHMCCRDRHPQTWFYYCEECDFEAHVYCVFIIHKNYH